jgi:hypothetical protein
MLLSNCFQYVSASGSSELDFNCWHATLKSYSESEFWWLFWAWSHLLTCCSQFASSMWVPVVVLSLILTADMSLSNHIQYVSASDCSELDFNCWHTTLKLLPGSKPLWLLWAWFHLLICYSQIASREWVPVVVLSLISIADILNHIQRVGPGDCSEHDFNCWHAALKSLSGCESW